MAGRRRGKKILPELNGILQSKKIHFSLKVTTRPREATEIARSSALDTDVLVAVGGDGTVNEVANGALQVGKTLGVIPIGSGNDFVKMFDIPHQLNDAVEVILAGNTQLIDVGEISTFGDVTTDQTHNTRYFVNTVGIGFDAAVADESRKMKHLRGLPLYLMALFRTIIKFRTPCVEMIFNNLAVNGKRFLVTIGNGTCAGGGFYLTPNAKVDDGLFDICAVDDLSIPRLLAVFPSALKGQHLRYPEVKMYRTNKFVLKSKDRLIVHIDGEIMSRDARCVEIGLIERRLRVIRK
jgi:YegS/Rv2252/BmrU family lipid kinase